MLLLLFIPLLLAMTHPAPAQLPTQETVVLIHGLARTPDSMNKMERALKKQNYRVVNLGYDSREHDIETLAKSVRSKIDAQAKDAEKIHIVAHSLGCILVRQIQATDPIENLERVVMLSPPNQGSEIVDEIGHWWLFKKINGPAGQQLGTDSGSVPNQLGSIDFECAVITGDRSINWINSLALVPGKDDGKVSVKSAKIEGLAAFKVAHVTHTFIMKNKAVIEDVVSFLQSGHFKDKAQ